MGRLAVAKAGYIQMVQVVDRRENNEAAFSRSMVFGVT